jgi:hypothetical protein
MEGIPPHPPTLRRPSLKPRSLMAGAFPFATRIWPDMHFTPFFEFAIVVVVVGSLIVLATAVWSANRVR